MCRGRIRSRGFLFLPLLAFELAASCAPAEVPDGRRRSRRTTDDRGVPPAWVAEDDLAAGARPGDTMLVYRDDVRSKDRERDRTPRGSPEQTVKGLAAGQMVEGRSADRTGEGSADSWTRRVGMDATTPEPSEAAPTVPAFAVVEVPAAVDPPGVPYDQGPPAEDAEKGEERGFARRPPVGAAESDARPEGALEVVGGAGASPEVRQLLRGQQSALQRCYDSLQLRSPGTSSGMVTIRLTLDPNGQVQSVEIVGGTIDEAEFNRCVLDHLRRLSFPRADSAATVTWPFRFGSGPAGAPE